MALSSSDRPLHAGIWDEHIRSSNLTRERQQGHSSRNSADFSVKLVFGNLHRSAFQLIHKN